MTELCHSLFFTIWSTMLLYTSRMFICWCSKIVFSFSKKEYCSCVERCQIQIKASDDVLNVCSLSSVIVSSDLVTTFRLSLKFVNRIRDWDVFITSEVAENSVCNDCCCCCYCLLTFCVCDLVIHWDNFNMMMILWVILLNWHC